VATISLSLDFEPSVDGVEVLGLAATVFDVLGDVRPEATCCFRAVL